MFVIAKRNIGKFEEGVKYKIIKELPFDYIVDLKNNTTTHISKEPMGIETDNFIFINK